MFSRRTSRIGRVALVVLVVGALSLCYPFMATAQPESDIYITATAEPSEVGTEEQVTFRIEVRGAALSEVTTPEPPPTANLVLQDATPRTERELSFESGSLRRHLTFEWTYRPLRVGIGRIKPTALRVQDEEYRTDEIRVRIVPQSQRPQRPRAGTAPAPPTGSSGENARARVGPRDLFIRAQASDETVYQNQQITAEYRLFFRPGVRLRQSRMADAWDAPGFWREELDVASRPTPRATDRYGETYKTIVLKRVALFPTQTGRLDVEPLRIETEAQARSRLGRQEGGTLPSHYQPVTLSSEELPVTVRPLPPGAPPTFDGAVGSFTLDTRLSADSVAVGEAVELTARLAGTGNIGTISPPPFTPKPDFESYDPTVTTNIDRSGSVIGGTKTFTYTLVPRKNGRYTLPPVRFTYFDPHKEEYNTLRSKPVTLRVTGDAAPRAASRTGEGLPVGKIAGPLENSDRWIRTNRPPLYAQPWTYVVLLVPAVLAAAGMAYRRRRSDENKADRRAEALNAAQNHLQDARRHLRNGDVRPFYEAVERSVLAFLDRRLRLPRSAHSMRGEALDRHLAQNGASFSDREALRKLLTACNEVQFTPAEPSSESMRSTVDDTETLLRRLNGALNERSE